MSNKKWHEGEGINAIIVSTIVLFVRIVRDAYSSLLGTLWEIQNYHGVTAFPCFDGSE
jgi:hypothetical protein